MYNFYFIENNNKYHVIFIQINKTHNEPILVLNPNKGSNTSFQLHYLGKYKPF